MLLASINTLCTCKDIAWLTVTGFGAGKKETAEVLITDLLTLFVELKCWYGSTIVTFTTSGVEAWKVLIERFAKIDLRTLQQTLTERLVLINT